MVPSVSSLVRLYEAVGRHGEESADEALGRVRESEEVAREAAVITVEMDGVMMAMGQDRRAQHQPLGAVEWKEASCATVTLGTAAGDPLRTVRHARMPERNKLRLKQLIRDEVTSLLARRSDLALVTVAHGAKDHGRFFDEAFPQADQVLDVSHAAEHLKAALDEAYGTNSEKATRRWHALRNTLLNDPRGVDRVMASLDDLRRRHRILKEQPSPHGLRRLPDAQPCHRIRSCRGDEQRSRHPAHEGIRHDLGPIGRAGHPLPAGPRHVRTIQHRMAIVAGTWAEKWHGTMMKQ